MGGWGWGYNTYMYKYNINLIKAARENRKNMTDSESIFWNLISNSKTGYVFRRQKPIGNFIVDFYCEQLKLVIEIDGEYHNENGFVERDVERETYLKSLNLKILRFKNYEVSDLSIVDLKKIFESFTTPTPSLTPTPNPSLKGRGINTSANAFVSLSGSLPLREGGGELIVVIGPTASGKSDRAVELALEIDGEVINADSRQVYKGLDVGTGKIIEEEMKGVRHHLLSYVEPKWSGTIPLREGGGGGELDGVCVLYSASRFVADARLAINDIISRGKVPIICGGTGMYIYTLIYGLDHDVKPDFKLREDLNKLETKELFNKYKEINGEPADNSISNNRPRLIRAIEIFENSKSENTTPSALLGTFPEERTEYKKIREPLYDVKYIRIERTKDQLRERITKRAEQRIDMMIDEVNRLLASGVDPNWLSRVGIEYGVILNIMQTNPHTTLTPTPSPSLKGRGTNTNANAFVSLSGSLPLTEGGGGGKENIISLIVTKSLQYVKRQNTWNKKYFK